MNTTNSTGQLAPSPNTLHQTFLNGTILSRQQTKVKRHFTCKITNWTLISRLDKSSPNWRVRSSNPPLAHFRCRCHTLLLPQSADEPKKKCDTASSQKLYNWSHLATTHHTWQHLVTIKKMTVSMGTMVQSWSRPTLTTVLGLLSMLHVIVFFLGRVLSIQAKIPGNFYHLAPFQV